MRVHVLVAFVTSLSLLACSGGSGDPPPLDAGGDGAVPGDAGVDTGPPDVGPLWEACEDTEREGTTNLSPVSSTLVASIDPLMTPLAVDGELNPAEREGELAYAEMGFDRYMHGDPWERVRRADLGGADATPGDRRSLAWMIHLADTQLVDDESPVRLANLDNSDAGGALRAHEAYVARAMSATNRTLTDLTAGGRPFDFGVIAGDCADNGQKNELRWFMQAMDGVAGLHFDSGDDDDPLPGPDNDPKDPFDPVAFPAPWLYVPGNHDVEILGILTVTDSQIRTATGGRSALGTRNYRRPFGAVATGTVPADEDRVPLTRPEIVEELFDTPSTPGPVGHGYPEDADLTHGAHYAYDAIPGLLRVLGFDTNDTEGGSLGLVKRATVDEWLVPELERAASDGVLVLLTSHHPTDQIDRAAGEVGETVADAVPPSELEEIVAAHPHVVAWLVGHTHMNRVKAVAGADADHPGYWEIMTSSLVDWPQQVRALEIVDNDDGTLSIFGTLIDFQETSCMERRYRRLGLMEYLAGWGDLVSLAPEDLNVELVIPVPASAAAAVTAARAGAPTRIESETTLRGTDG